MKLPEYISFVSENRSIETAKIIYDQRIEDANLIYRLFSEKFYHRNCPICDSSEYENEDPFIGIYNIAKCKRCSSLYVNPCPNYDALNYYYNQCKCNFQLGKLYRDRPAKSNLIIDERTQKVISIIHKQLELNDNISILEIGCSSGVFLSNLKQNLKKSGLLKRVLLYGIDIDCEAINRNIDTELKLECASAENFSTNSNFDLILHFELIEHLNNPFEFLRSTYNLLKKGGIQHFHTPNGKGFDNLALGYNNFRPLAHGIFPPMHLQSFNVQNISHFLLRCGFSINEIETPGNFDVDITEKCKTHIHIENSFKFIDKFSNEQLAIIQSWLRELCASSAMRCTISKN